MEQELLLVCLCTEDVRDWTACARGTSRRGPSAGASRSYRGTTSGRRADGEKSGLSHD